MSDAFFKTIHISNFKSLKEVTLSDCKRINVLIGKPNVGKSNILEAIGLFSLPYVWYDHKKLTHFVRLENLSELFFDGNKEKDILITEVNTRQYCKIEYKNKTLGKLILIKIGLFLEEFFINIDKNFNISGYSYPIKSDSSIKSYKFIHDNFYMKKYKSITDIHYLLPPIGVNLIEVIQENRELKKDLIKIFSEYSLKLLFDKGSNSLRIMKETKDGEVFSIPYSSIADTLQRVIFFKTAIASNKNSILLFEEPEAHCFPPYIAHFTQDVLDSETNQFFIATHSPYVLNDFLEYKRADVAIFMADFKDGQTVINRLTDEEVNEVYEYGIDLFFNYELFTHD